MLKQIFGAIGIAITLGIADGRAYGSEQKATNTASQEVEGSTLHETVTPVFQRLIPNISGRRMVAVVVTYPPGAKSPAHRHAPSAFIYAYVLSGSIRSQINGGAPKVYQAGEGFYEDPGSHHRVSENASASEPSSMLAVFIVDPKESPLTVPERQ
ncbi:cupin domain-containing protein (plasmid) [Microvirga terrae]|uniref:Cupin domain-containing protein n=1 Tax=Microvirga terrae TaxID=2740529 RepID=A0ABY5S222_9HYPH|nr:cupin domain-containing protein [Microvirga terrae]UVF22581.1 cupin domain-containing protein [Microvirga terrae]